MLSRTLLTQSSKLLTLKSLPKISNPLTNQLLRRSYSLATTHHTSKVEFDQRFQPSKFFNNQRIYEQARLPTNSEENEVYEDIYNLIQDRILPNIQEDGGNMEFRGFDFDNGIVFVKLTGACTSCSMSETTLKHGIEGMLTYFIPEVQGVQQVFDPEEQIAMSEFEKFEKNLQSKRSS